MRLIRNKSFHLVSKLILVFVFFLPLVLYLVTILQEKEASGIFFSVSYFVLWVIFCVLLLKSNKTTPAMVSSGNEVQQPQTARTELSNLFARPIHGEVADYAAVEDTLRQYGIVLNSNRFLLILIFPEKGGVACLSSKHGQALDEELWTIVTGVLEKQTSELFHTFHINVEGKLLLLASPVETSGEAATQQAAAQMARHTLEALEAAVGTSLCAAISAVHEGIPEIAPAFAETLEIVDYITLMGVPAQKAIPYRQVDAGKLAEQLLRRAEESEDVLICIQQQEYDRAMELLSRSIDAAADYTMIHLRLGRYRLYSLVKMILEIFTALQEFTDINLLAKLRLPQRLLDCSTLMELRAELPKLFKDLEECTRQEDSSPDKVHLVAHYIQKNYMDTELNVTAVAGLFRINQSYLSRVFKKEMGIGVLGYIHKVRLENAKLLLDDETLSVKDIARRVGYYNSLTMIRAFKRYEGVTPGRFREN